MPLTDKQKEITKRILNNLQPETLHMLRTMELKKDSDELSSELDDLETEMNNATIDAKEKELEARLKIEEDETRMLKRLNKILERELEEKQKLLERSNKSASTRKTAEANLRVTKKMGQERKPDEEIDVLALIAMHKENEKKREREEELKKELAVYEGLPPNLADAREAIKRLTEEVNLLQQGAKQRAEDDAAKYFSMKYDS